MYARGRFIRQVSRGVVLSKLRVTCVPLPVDCSQLKPDDTSGFQKPSAPPPLFLTRLTCPFEQAAHQKCRRTPIRIGSEFGQAQTPVPHFCGSSSLAPLPSLHITIGGVERTTYLVLAIASTCSSSLLPLGVSLPPFFVLA